MPENNIPLIPPEGRLKERKSLKNLGLALALGTVGCEWTWGIYMSSLVFNGAQILALIAILYSGKRLGAFRFNYLSATKRNFGLLLLLLFGVVIILERILSSPFDVPITASVLRIYYGLLLCILCGIIGYRIGVRQWNTYWFLNFMACVIAIVSVYFYLFPLPREAEAIYRFPSLLVGFPVRFFSLYAFCWYLFRWLGELKIFSRTLLFLLTSAFPVLVAFHKPLVFSAMLSGLAIFVIMMIRGPSRVRTITRSYLLLMMAILLFIFANAISRGRIFADYKQQFFNYFLHDAGGYGFASNAELLESASGRRVVLWKEGLTRFFGSPWVGSGFGQTIESEYSAESIPFHNGYLDLLLSIGILGALPFAILVGGWVKMVYSATAKRRFADFIPVFAYIVGLAGYNMGGTSRLFYFVSAFAALLMGVASGHIHMEGALQSLIRNRRRAAREG
jgi:O-antigen ligase